MTFFAWVSNSNSLRNLSDAWQLFAWVFWDCLGFEFQVHLTFNFWPWNFDPVKPIQRSDQEFMATVRKFRLQGFWTGVTVAYNEDNCFNLSSQLPTYSQRQSLTSQVIAWIQWYDDACNWNCSRIGYMFGSWCILCDLVSPNQFSNVI